MQINVFYCITFATMKVQNVLLIGAAGWLVIRAIGLKKVSDEVSFVPASLGVKRDGRRIVVNFGLDINNPAPASATINRTFGNIEDANGNILGRFNVPTYRIEANGTTRINIPITIEAFGALQAVLSSILNKNAKVTINYTNEVGLLSVSDRYAFDLKEALNFPAIKNLTNKKQTKANPATQTI
jgi:hypothetical protein